jgi:hypothetical protein
MPNPELAAERASGADNGMTRSLGLGVIGTVLQKKIVTSNTYSEYLAEGEEPGSNILR